MHFMFMIHFPPHMGLMGSFMNRVADHVCQCFSEDIMHILLEGVVPYETKQFLKVLIDETRGLTLKALNH